LNWQEHSETKLKFAFVTEISKALFVVKHDALRWSAGIGTK